MSGFMDKAKEFAAQATHKATQLANEAAEKAGPLAERAAEKAGPLAEKAGDMASKGVDAAASSIDKATGGKYSDQISGVHEKIGSVLDRDAHLTHPKHGDTQHGTPNAPQQPGPAQPGTPSSNGTVPPEN
jgi:hypothetical protein